MFFTYLLSGYGLIKTSIVEKLTLGLINYRVSIILHTDIFLRILIVIVSILHSITGFTMLSLRIKRVILRKIMIFVVHLLFIILLLFFLLIEFSP